MSKFANADASINNARLSDSLPELIEQISNELKVLDQHLERASGIADRLHGAPPPAPANALGLTAVQSDPDGLLGKLRVRLDQLSEINNGFGRELARISNAL
ncbi:hypothetical protein [Bradyrhizobium japonicum]|uniref:hypothetical protein n=1 Tax=Bradyrhizobium japonicum TaxID=375 RepID=UPI000417FC4B|nr:hypothetical protein [Bradyrhizobium japonicum]